RLSASAAVLVRSPCETRQWPLESCPARPAAFRKPCAPVRACTLFPVRVPLLRSIACNGGCDPAPAAPALSRSQGPRVEECSRPDLSHFLRLLHRDRAARDRIQTLSTFARLSLPACPLAPESST